jgi:antitoxin component YwqK of YwqJK toxin-antitoxin module
MRQGMKRVSEDSLEYVNGHYFLGDEPFTGVGFAHHPDGWLQVEIEYKDGLKWGTQREWFAPDQLLTEAELQSGLVHGKKRSWHRNGKLAEEGEYESGVALRRKKRDEDGNLVEDFELKEEPDSSFDFLEKLREIQKKRSGKQWADLLRNGRLHPWQPGDPIPSRGPRILLGLDITSAANSALLDKLNKAQGQGSTGPRIDIFDVLECRPIQGFEEYVPGIGKVFQAPVVGYWQDGKLMEKAWGKDGRDLFFKVVGLSA